MTTVKLREVGKVLSAKNQTALKAALDQLAAVLQLVTPAETGAVAPDEAQVSHDLGVAVGESFGVRLHECSADCAPVLVDMREAKGLSFGTIQEGISRALRAKYPPLPGEYSSVWAREVFDDYFVWSDGKGQLYKSTYTVDESGIVTMADNPTKVVERKSYVAVKESESATDADVDEARTNDSGLVMLNEASAVNADGRGMVKLISPGWGSSGYYSPAVLEAAATDKVFGRGTKMYWDHPTAEEEAARPERSLRDLSAVLDEDARWDPVGPKGKDGKPRGPGLYAEATVLKAYRDSVNDLAPHIGVSIRALGKASDGVAEGKKGRIIDKLATARSVDFVTAAGRGGEILQLFESARAKAYEALANDEGNVEGDIDTVSEAELNEARQRAEAAEAREKALLTENARLAAQTFITKAVGDADLPSLARTRLIESLSAETPVLGADGKLDESALKAKVDKAIVAESAYILELTGRKRDAAPDVRGMGGFSESDRSTGDTNDPKALAAQEAELAKAFGSLGLSESQAAIAAAGRH